MRFAPEQVALLQEMKWLDWSDEQLREAMPLLTSGDVTGLHAYWRSRIAG